MDETIIVPPQTLAIHATAVAIDGRAIVIRGPSKAGKSSLALALLELRQPGRVIHLIGDDRVILERAMLGGAVSVSPHPRIAGLIEKRGTGILARHWVEKIDLFGIVDLGPAADPPGLMDRAIPILDLSKLDWSRRPQAVLAWYAATLTAQCHGKVFRAEAAA